jgi:hypothetical protein
MHLLLYVVINGSPDILGITCCTVITISLAVHTTRPCRQEILAEKRYSTSFIDMQRMLRDLRENGNILSSWKDNIKPDLVSVTNG